MTSGKWALMLATLGMLTGCVEALAIVNNPVIYLLSSNAANDRRARLAQVAEVLYQSSSAIYFYAARNDRPAGQRKLLAQIKADTEPAGDEQLKQVSHWPDGTRQKKFVGQGFDGRLVELDAKGRPVKEVIDSLIPAGDAENRIAAFSVSQADPVGTGVFSMKRETLLDGDVARYRFQNCTYKNTAKKVSMTLKSLDTPVKLDSPGSFVLEYGTLGLTEEGTFEAGDASYLTIDNLYLFDPLQAIPGKSTVKGADGKVAFNKELFNKAGMIGKNFTWPDGAKLNFAAYDRGTFAATMTYNGVVYDDLVVTIQPHEFVTISSTKEGWTVGFGVQGPIKDQTPVAKKASSQTNWQVTTLAGNGVGGFSNAEDGNATQFNFPTGVLTQGDAVYVADYRNNRIRRLVSSKTEFGTVLTASSTFAGSGSPGVQDGAGLQAEFNGPIAIVSGPDGTFYVAEALGHRIRKITVDGVVSTFAGDGTAGFLDGPAATARFNTPSDLTVDASGNVYVADHQNERIRKIAPDGTVSTLAGTGTAGFADGEAATAQFNKPFGIRRDGNGNLYVTDQGNYCIRKITAAGQVSTFAGSRTQGAEDGTAAAAKLFQPSNLAIDAAGTVYFTDTGLRQVKFITPAGEVQTLAGDGLNLSENGMARLASFTQPVGLDVSADGKTILVADQSGHRIRRIAKE